MSISFWQQARRAHTAAYDVVIVGGGIVGCSTAYWLQRRRPSLRVGLVEAHSLGAGASGRSAGFVHQGASFDYLSDVQQYGERTARRLWHFTRANRDLMASELQGTAFGWESEGSLTAAAETQDAERLQASVAHLRAAGAPVVYLGPERVNRRLEATGLRGGLYVTTGAVVDPLRLVRHLAHASDADMHTHLPVQQIHWEEEEGVLVDTADLRLWGRRVVLTLGAALPLLAPSLSAYVRPVRGQMLATAPAETRSIPVPVHSHRGDFYVRQLRNGDVLAGGGRKSHSDAEKTRTTSTTPAVQATIERYLHTHYPWTQALTIRRRWGGTMGCSPDGRPVVGPVPEHADSVYATGFNGRGIGYGFRMGRLLAQRACGETAPDGYDLFADDRFSEEDLRTDREVTQEEESPGA